MFSDIVSYDSLLKEDEKKAFEIRKTNQRIHRRLIKKYNGRWLKEMESGTLASFSSNIDAVMCAVSIQKATEEMNIPLRIGIHQGDVIFEKKDVMGDGVNIASRIQGLADSYDIVISGRVYDDIKNKEGLNVEFLGERSLKGVIKPTPVYKVSFRDEGLQDFTIDTGELIRPFRFGRISIIGGVVFIALLLYAVYYFFPKPETSTDFKKGVLILPFDNFTSDTLEYYTAGMHNALITDVGKISALKVISKTTAKAYKNINKSIPEIASELGVNAIIEGAVTCLGDSVCLRIKMKNVDGNEEPLLVQDFYVEKSQILSLYDNVARELSDKINIKLTSADERRLSEYRTVDPEAYAAYLKGQEYWEQLSRESMPKALEYFQIAIEKDPDWAPPYAGLALSYAILGGFGYMPMTTALPKHYNNLNKALELDPNTAEGHFAAAITATWWEWDWERGEQEFLKSLDLYANYALCRVYYAHLLLILNRFEEAIYHAEIAVETDPLSLVVALYGQVMNEIGDYQSALSRGEKALSIDPDNNFVPSVMYWAYQGLGDYEEWFKIVKERKFSFYEQHGVAELQAKLREVEGSFSSEGQYILDCSLIQDTLSEMLKYTPIPNNGLHNIFHNNLMLFHNFSLPYIFPPGQFHTLDLLGVLLHEVLLPLP